jgi:hypothetical protein
MYVLCFEHLHYWTGPDPAPGHDDRTCVKEQPAVNVAKELVPENKRLFHLHSRKSHFIVKLSVPGVVPSSVRLPGRATFGRIGSGCCS